MALPDSQKLVDGTAFVVSHADFVGSAWTTDWSGTNDATIELEGILTTAYEQSTKLDLTANRDELYSVSMSIEMATDPSAGDNIVVYVSFSDSATAGTGNMANLSGAVGAYTGASTGTAAVGVQGMDIVGVLSLDVLNDTDDVQVGHVGYFTPRGRYAIFVVHNNSGVSTHSDNVESAIFVRGINNQTQD